jgi:hypothetical protein
MSIIRLDVDVYAGDMLPDRWRLVGMEHLSKAIS